MNRLKINDVLLLEKSTGEITVKGWIRTKRNSKTFSFLELNDGSCLENIQIIADESLVNYNEICSLTTGSAISVTGLLLESLGKGQKWEIKAEGIFIYSTAPDSFPLQKKRHSDEYLRSIAHLRPRTNKYGAIFRIRSEVSLIIHDYFHNKNFYYIHTPIITGSDCEGAGELFNITTLDFENMPEIDGKTDFSTDFFGKRTNLTVSGQLSAEMFALSLGDVYTFGPTFRAENSNTSRHVSEFWMIEPEMAFCDLKENMDIAEEFIKYVIKNVIQRRESDINLFAKFVDKNLMPTLNNIILNTFERIQYKEAVDILLKSEKKFEFDVKYGSDLQSEHERFITEEYFKKPVFVYNYPKTIKPFYMRLNEDNETVAAMDLLVPNIGELIGGSQREERLDILKIRMDESNINKEDYWWYLDSRKYGSVPHSGFGLGFERLLMLLTGVSNIRDVIPFPRVPGNIDF